MGKNNKKYTLDEVRRIVKSKGFELVSEEYVNNKQKLVLRDAEGYLCTTCLDKLNQNKFPLKYHKSNPYTIYNINLWLILYDKPLKLISKQYINNKIPLLWKCLTEKCGEVFDLSWDSIYQGQICPFCSSKRVGLSNCFATKNPELISEWHPTLNGDLTPYMVFSNSHDKFWWLCKENHKWKATLNSRSSMKSGCPVCSESKGEKQIDFILTQYDIPHDSQYTFEDLLGVGGRLLRYDVPVFWDEEQTNLRMLIEYDGEFHYKKFYEDDGFETLQIHDKLKNKYCKNNNIKLLRIPFWDFDNIEDILIRELNIYITNDSNLTVVF